MSSGWTIDLDSMAAFRTTAAGVQHDLAGLRGSVADAALPPGTFTQTEGGKIADQGHAQVVDGLGELLGASVELLDMVVEKAGATIADTTATDEGSALPFSAFESGLDTTRQDGA